MKPSFRSAGIPVTVILVLAGANDHRGRAPASEVSPLEPFSMPWNDDSKGPADVSFLLDPPAGGKGLVTARDGHFFTGDRRIRFWGVNVCFAGCFPSHEDAVAIAGRLAKFGVNCVRFHHMDMNPFPSGIFADSKLEELSDAALDRLDFFVAELALRGIYSNLNLHVSRWLSRARRWPEADRLPSFDKIVDIFHPDLIAAQKRYARDLLTHLNRYTGHRYVEEPAVAMVEITNEDSLFQWGTPSSIAELPEPYAGVLRAQWNEWLVRRHGTGARLREAWSRGEEPLGPSMIRDGDFATLFDTSQAGSAWICEQHEGAEATISKGKPVEEHGSVRVEVRNPTAVSWHVQFKQNGLRLAKGGFYTVEFRARADRRKTIGAAVGQDHEPWANLGLSRSARLNVSWEAYRYGFVATGDEGNARLSFSLGEDDTAVELADVRLGTGGRMGLCPGESLEEKSVALFTEGELVTEARLEDRLRFLMDAEKAFFVGMRKYLKEELGVRAPVTGTIAFGALGTLVQAEMDFVDQHAYWQHPHFPRRPWDPRDWVVPNAAMSASQSGGALPGLASTRIFGKPYTVTEYNHPAPLESQAETVPMIATFAAWQDWDGVFLFAYNHSGQFRVDRIQSFFDIDGNPAKMGFCGVGSLIFCGGLLPPSLSQVTGSLIAAEAVRAAVSDPTHLTPYLAHGGFSMELLMKARWALEYRAAAVAMELTPSSAGGALRWDLTKGHERYVVDAAAVKAVCGSVETPLLISGFRLDISAPRIASLVLASCDAQPLDRSRRMLLVACGRCENTGMGWNGDRTSVGDKWGRSPVLIETLRGRIELGGSPLQGVFSLDGRGQRQAEVAIESTSSSSTFELGRAAGTLWWELVR